MADLGVSTAGQLEQMAALRPFLLSLTLHLYSNDVDWDPGNVVGDYLEITWPGYVPVLLVGWQVPYVTADGVVEIDEQIRGFGPASGGPYTVQGYYLTTPDGLLFAAVSNEITGGQVVPGPAYTYYVQPRYVGGVLC